MIQPRIAGTRFSHSYFSVMMSLSNGINRHPKLGNRMATSRRRASWRRSWPQMWQAGYQAIDLAQLLSWGALGVMLYAYLGYPALLLLVARLRPFRVSACSSELPSVTMIVAAWNEEAVIASKVENTLTQDYPRERLSLIVVSDGSTDSTDLIVERYAAETPRVQLLRTAGREGKSVALNIGAAAACGDVLVMTDANAIFEPDAVRRLVCPLSDPAVGSVSGQLLYRKGKGTEATEGAYWRYEQVVKRLESGMGSLLGANGSIYALRRALYHPIRPRDVNDFRLPYEVLLAGKAVVLEQRAISVEAAAGDLWGEYSRKARIMSRAIPTMLGLIPRTLAKGRLLLLWQLVSHKLLREVQGIFFLAMLVGAAWGAAAGDVLLLKFLVAQLLLYAIGALGWALPHADPRPLHLAAHFDMIALASVAALGRWLGGRVRATWEPTRAPGREA